MADGKHCPACGIDIGIWPIFSAGLPNLVRCPRCKASLYYRSAGWFWLTILLAVAAVTVAAWYVAKEFGGSNWLWIFAGVLFAAWVPVELLAAWYLRKYKVLSSRSGATSHYSQDKS
jgi:hypothetical protein